ncbi:MAG TPA: histidinol-phosphate transaminase [Pyrinomonadaceae bacterium]|nr:histidinol-phosphate transaminase [Pyrinomonadaceae bacterium]
MFEPVDIIKPKARTLRAYTLSGHRAAVKINQNENPWDAPARIKAETERRLATRPWSRYPDFGRAALHEQLAKFAGWTAAGVLAGNGSNELIQAILMVTVGVGRRVLICEPTFALYRQIVTLLDGEVLSVPLTETLSYDIGLLERTLAERKPHVTIICSPNNPTGCAIDDDDLRRLLKESTGLVIVDEAYHEFSGHSVVPLLKDFANLVVLRTFSKAMAMAGLRIGYMLASPELAREVSKALLPYNLNVISQTAAEVAIQFYEEELRPRVASIVAERNRLFTELENIWGLAPVPSRANFMVVRSRIEPQKLFTELLRRDILVRDVSAYPMLSDYFRVSVGTPEENDKLMSALREILEQE